MEACIVIPRDHVELISNTCDSKKNIDRNEYINGKTDKVSFFDYEFNCIERKAILLNVTIYFKKLLAEVIVRGRECSNNCTIKVTDKEMIFFFYNDADKSNDTGMSFKFYHGYDCNITCNNITFFAEEMFFQASADFLFNHLNKVEGENKVCLYALNSNKNELFIKQFDMNRKVLNEKLKFNPRLSVSRNIPKYGKHIGCTISKQGIQSVCTNEYIRIKYNVNYTYSMYAVDLMERFELEAMKNFPVTPTEYFDILVKTSSIKNMIDIILEDNMKAYIIDDYLLCVVNIGKSYSVV